MSKGIVLALVAGLTALALLAAGCGGGDDETTSLTRSQFLKQANAMCEEQEERRNQAIQDAIKGKDQSKLLPLEQREEVVLTILPAYEEIPEKLEALGPPEGDEEKVEAIAEAIEKAARDVKADPAEALNSTSQFTQANKLSTEYGLTSCAI